MKIWSLFKHEDRITGNKVLWSNFSSFPQYFQYISNFRSQIIDSFVKCCCSIYFFPEVCKSDMSRDGYRSISENLLDFEIKRADSTFTLAVVWVISVWDNVSIVLRVNTTRDSHYLKHWKLKLVFEEKYIYFVLLYAPYITAPFISKY